MIRSSVPLVLFALLVSASAVRAGSVYVFEKTAVNGRTNDLRQVAGLSGSIYRTQVAPVIDGQVFVGWTATPALELDSRDTWGRARDAATCRVPEGPLVLVANYVNVYVDSNGNHVPDGWELYWYGRLGVDAGSDTDGDGYTFAQELEAGTNPLFPDVSLTGGLVGAGVNGFVMPADPRPLCLVRSEPAGELFETTLTRYAPDEEVRLPAAGGADSAFAYWTVGGKIQRDAWGRAADGLVFAMPSNDVEVVAVCVTDPVARAKIHWYGTEDVALDGDTDGDGYTFAQELEAGTNPLFPDRTLAGGMVGADAAGLLVLRVVLELPVNCPSATLSDGDKAQIRGAVENRLPEGVSSLTVEGPDDIALIADLGILPKIADAPDADGALKIVYARPEIRIVAFDPRAGTLRIRVTPGEGNEILFPPEAACLRVYGTTDLGREMRPISSVSVNLEPYLQKGTEGEAELTVDLREATFLRAGAGRERVRAY